MRVTAAVRGNLNPASPGIRPMGCVHTERPVTKPAAAGAFLAMHAGELAIWSQLSLLCLCCSQSQGSVLTQFALPLPQKRMCRCRIRPPCVFRKAQSAPRSHGTSFRATGKSTVPAMWPFKLHWMRYFGQSCFLLFFRRLSVHTAQAAASIALLIHWATSFQNLKAASKGCGTVGGLLSQQRSLPMQPRRSSQLNNA